MLPTRLVSSQVCLCTVRLRPGHQAARERTFQPSVLTASQVPFRLLLEESSEVTQVKFAFSSDEQRPERERGVWEVTQHGGGTTRPPAPGLPHLPLPTPFCAPHSHQGDEEGGPLLRSPGISC